MRSGESSLVVVRLHLSKRSCVTAVLLLTTLHLWQSRALAQTPYTGGDKQPLTWSSAQHLDRPGGSTGLPTYTYTRTVENHSAQDVTDIYWPVAGYAKKIIPAHRPLTDRVSLQGYLAIPSPKGDLHYGAGPDLYHTTVYAPKDGWTSPSAITSAQLRPFESELQVAVPAKTGSTICTVHLKSEIIQAPGNKPVEYRYYLSNDSPAALQLFWSIPGTPDFREQLKYNRERPLSLSPNQSFTLSAKSNEPPATYLTTVFINDAENKLVGRSVVAAWAAKTAEAFSTIRADWRQ
jgi:hypothetical protein